MFHAVCFFSGVCVLCIDGFLGFIVGPGINCYEWRWGVCMSVGWRGVVMQKKENKKIGQQSVTAT